jgi:signal transduction histidine kinase
MSAPADTLWWLSHEYGQRLARASSYLELLEQLLSERLPAHEGGLIDALADARAYLEALREEFRAWRYAYFYETPDSKRMVQNERAITSALISFQRMRERHMEFLNTLSSYFAGITRPEPRITRVAMGDLWVLTIESVDGLITFDADHSGVIG